MVEIIDMHGRGNIKGQKYYVGESGCKPGSTKKTVKKIVNKAFSINSFHCLAGGLTHDDWLELLSDVIAKKYTYEELGAVAKGRKGIYKVTNALTDTYGRNKI